MRKNTTFLVLSGVLLIILLATNSAGAQSVGPIADSGVTYPSPRPLPQTTYAQDGQGWVIPFPRSTSESPAVCHVGACRDSRGGKLGYVFPNGRTIPASLPMVSYPNPPLKFVGRFLDAIQAPGFWSPYRPLEADDGFLFNPQRNRIYTALGSSLTVYNLNDFFTAKIKEPLKLFRARDRGEAYIPGVAHFYPPESQKSGWWISVSEGIDRMQGIDFDDRGYIYITTGPWGWGIVRDTGADIVPVIQALNFYSDGTARQPTNSSNKIVSFQDKEYGPTCRSVLSFRVGEKYYLYCYSSGSNVQTLYDVTDVSAPKFLWNNFSLLNRPFRVEKILPSGSTEHVLVFSRQGVPERTMVLLGAGSTAQPFGVLFYDASDFVAQRLPQKTFPISPETQSYTQAITDGVKAYAISYASSTQGLEAKLPMTFSIFSPQGGNRAEHYVEKKFATREKSESRLLRLEFKSANGGYITALGTYGNNDPLRIFRVADSGFTEVNTDGYFEKYYRRQHLPTGYAGMGQDIIYKGADLYSQNGKTYLVLSAYGLGDVYEITGDSADTTQTTTPTIAGCLPGYIYSYLTGVRCDGTGGQGTFGSNVAPSIGSAVSGPTALAVGQQGTWTITAKDEDDLSWSVDWGSGRSTHTCEVNPGAGTSQNSSYVISHSWVTPGTKTVKVYADDCKGGTTEKTFTVTVSGGGGEGGIGDELDRAY